MSYTQAVFSAAAMLGALAGVLFCYFPILGLIGVFAKRRYPATEKRLRYGVIISARNEERVIGALLDSIRANRYPRDKVTVFVMAHNCTDRTAQVSRDHGGVVYEYQNPAEARVGYAYRELFRRVAADYGLDAFDGFLILDADNLLAPDYLERMNEAFVAGGGEAVVTSFRNAKNFSHSCLTALYGLLFAVFCRLEARGRSVCGWASRVTGTGYIVPVALVKDGWSYTTLTEDWELTAHVVAQGGKILYCDGAEFFDEQPTHLAMMLRQRLRWARGHMEAFLTRGGEVVASLGRRGNRPSKYDMALQLLPLGAITLTLGAAELAALCLCPLFGESLADALSCWAGGLLRSLATAYVSIFPSGPLVLWLERRRLARLRPLTALGAILWWPVFLTLAIPLDLAAVFVKNLAWKPIPHAVSSREVTGIEVSSPH